MKIHEANIYNPPTPNRCPGRGKPGLFDKTINQNVEVRFAVFVKFQYCDVFGCGTVFSAQVRPELIEGMAKIDDRIALDLFRIKGEGDESL